MVSRSVEGSRPVLQMATDGSAKTDRTEYRASPQLKEAMCTFFEDNVIKFNVSPDGTVGLPVLFDTNVISIVYFWVLTEVSNAYIFFVPIQPSGASLKC